TSNPGLAANTEVASMVSQNKMSATTSQTFDCYYVDDDDKYVAKCSVAVPSNATGVHVSVTEKHDTYFIRIVPGAPKTVSTTASATAHVQAVTSGLGSDSPFVVCGIDTDLASGGTMSILRSQTAMESTGSRTVAASVVYPIYTGSSYQVVLLKKKTTPTPEPTADPSATATGTATGGGGSGGGSGYSIAPAAYGQTFLLHGPQVADCGNKSNSFKGLADPDSNYGKSIPGWFDTLTGTKAGPTRVRVNGIQGCDVGTTDPNGCVLIVPIASQASNGEFYVVTIGAFLVTQSHANAHVGVLLENYQIQVNGLGEWDGSNGWTPGAGGLVTVRLSE
ncbi:MAG: TadG family pilus assembly protein, partial [Nitrolancea sp.]